MKRMIAALCFIFALSAFAYADGTVPVQGGETMKAGEKKPAKKSASAAPKTDADIQKCISDKFANSEKLKSQGFSTTVSSGEATLTGTAQNAGSKGAATRIAKSCGASKVTNNITAPAIPKASKPAEKKM